ncbi:16S rRNA (adenine(1518)-N(6)/adenine(1519)-N(6))-dimethyltransferase RsmA [Candidatus Formimonas warabiya]|uniref:Ribosomal RNA small subunit methyltransferase A n=1 Tax=Formimonas warabiya TaxID=1761012 RepID=A0A3G1KVD5_FORW1|nr:16S rRNA (adenine(1518)-N(6)/adenine(1519)-N(6))-dimethyltransferase RsmA [Candidatus Formimonas warabiya]ATW26483.1 16S rRNA (adenine(1518)-N(6)/adenine(1519)-N(6))-dimethyltransferase [Candidatus Formimonas warabiya]
MDVIATPRITREIVHKYGLNIRKSLGQNFLIEPKFIQKIIDAAGLDQNKVVVEIGPGIGALTQALATHAGYVIAVEIDQGLTRVLKEIFAPVSNVTIVHGDAMKVNFDQLVAEVPHRQEPPFPYKIVANLPYYITTPMIMRLLEEGFQFSSLVLMVQREVAQRIMAHPATKDYGALSIGVQYHCSPSLVSLVPPTVFHPRPEVDSAIIKLEKREHPAVHVSDERLFFSLVKAAFNQRRKTLLNALSNSGLLLSKNSWQEVLIESGIDPQRRGETLNLEEFASLANLLGRKR